MTYQDVCGYTVNAVEGTISPIEGTCNQIYGTEAEEWVCCDSFSYVGYTCEMLTSEYDYDCAGCGCPLDAAAAVCGDGSCVFSENFLTCPGDCEETFGCKDPQALNYDSTADTDNGACQYPLDCTGSACCCNVVMTDEFGDGWNSAVLTLTVNGTDSIFGTTFTSGEEATNMIEICDFNAVSYSMSAGDWPDEVSWSVTCPGDNSISGL
jgi:hypothetical protein